MYETTGNGKDILLNFIKKYIFILLKTNISSDIIFHYVEVIVMAQENRMYIAIDLKSFYASVECVERGLDPMTTNLVVADLSRTEKTICLAVSPSLKAYGQGCSRWYRG